MRAGFSGLNSELLISGTTNERGNIETTLSADYQILGCKSEKNDYYAIPYYSNATHEWWLRCKNWELDILNYTGTTNSSGVLDLPLKSKYIISIIILTPQDCIGLYGTSGSSTWIKVLKYDMSVAGDTSVSVSILYSNK